MSLEELIEKISDIKKDLVDFYNLCFECDEIIDNDWMIILDHKEAAYYNLVEIKNILEELQSKDS